MITLLIPGAPRTANSLEHFFLSPPKLLFSLPVLQKVAIGTLRCCLSSVPTIYLFIAVGNVLPACVRASASRWERLIKARMCLGVSAQLNLRADNSESPQGLWHGNRKSGLMDYQQQAAGSLYKALTAESSGEEGKSKRPKKGQRQRK